MAERLVALSLAPSWTDSRRSPAAHCPTRNSHHINQHFDATEGDEGVHDLDQLAAEYAYLDDDYGGGATG